MRDEPGRTLDVGMRSGFGRQRWVAPWVHRRHKVKGKEEKVNLYAPKEAADLLRVHPKTFRRWAQESGVRPVVLRPNCRRFTEDQVLAIANAKKAKT